MNSYIMVELVFKSYMPKTLEKGMWFIDATPDEIRIWELDKIPPNISMEKFIVENGAPVEPYLVDDGHPIAEPHQIAWIDDGEHTDELRELTLDDINIIVNEYEGWVDVEIDEQAFDDDWEVVPILYNDKVTIALPDTYSEEAENEKYGEEEEQD